MLIFGVFMLVICLVLAGYSLARIVIDELAVRARLVSGYCFDRHLFF